MNNELGGSIEVWREQARLCQPGFETWVADGPPFRKGTEVPVLVQNLVFAGAGMGDYICWIPAIKWIDKNCPWVRPKLHVPRSFGFVELATEAFEGTRVSIHPIGDRLEINEMEFILGPSVKHNGQYHRQLVNGTGGSLVDCGYLQFVNTYPSPVGWTDYHQLKPKPELIPSEIRYKKYVAFTTGGACPNRIVPGHFWNGPIDHVLSKGLTPVFLGKREMERHHEVKFPEGCDYHKGVDLRDKTKLLDAAEIMRHAQCVVGLDNGLLHLAGCTTAKIVAIFNIVHPDQRRPGRQGLEHRWLQVTLTQKELECVHCQTNMKRLSSENVHNFRHCLYKKPHPTKKDESVPDTKCLDMLFSGSRIERAIDEMLTR